MGLLHESVVLSAPRLRGLPSPDPTIGRRRRGVKKAPRTLSRPRLLPGGTSCGRDYSSIARIMRWGWCFAISRAPNCARYLLYSKRVHCDALNSDITLSVTNPRFSSPGESRRTSGGPRRTHSFRRVDVCPGWQAPTERRLAWSRPGAVRRKCCARP